MAFRHNTSRLNRIQSIPSLARFPYQISHLMLRLNRSFHFCYPVVSRLRHQHTQFETKHSPRLQSLLISIEASACPVSSQQSCSPLHHQSTQLPRRHHFSPLRLPVQVPRRGRRKKCFPLNPRIIATSRNDPQSPVSSAARTLVRLRRVEKDGRGVLRCGVKGSR